MSASGSTVPGLEGPADAGYAEREAAAAERLPAAVVRRRAEAGAALLITRGLALRLLGLASNVVLARLLLPRDFGLVALGSTFLVFGTVVASAGVGSALIRRREAPLRSELEALLGLQLAITAAIAAGVALAAWPFGERGWVVAVMVASLPLSTLRTPGTLVLERDLLYRPLTVVEVAETVVYYAWAITTVVAGWGVWGLATAVLVRPLAGVAVLTRVGPIGLIKPRRTWGELQGLLKFGIRFQAAWLTQVLRDFGLSFGTTAIAGLSTLGLWSLASRVLELPTLAFSSLWKVSYPTMSRLLEGGEDARPIVERTIGVVAFSTGIVITPLVASAPALVPALFGDRWQEAVDVLPWAGLALMLSGPVSIAATGYLYAIGDAAIVLRSQLLSAVAWLAVTFMLLGKVGVVALGIGAMASAAVDITVLGRATVRRSKAQIAVPLALPTAAAIVAGALGWAIASSAEVSLLTTAVAGGAAEAAYLVLLLPVRAQLMRDTLGIAGRAFRGAVARAQ